MEPSIFQTVTETPTQIAGLVGGHAYRVQNSDVLPNYASSLHVPAPVFWMQNNGSVPPLTNKAVLRPHEEVIMYPLPGDAIWVWTPEGAQERLLAIHRVTQRRKVTMRNNYVAQAAVGDVTANGRFFYNATSNMLTVRRGAQDGAYWRGLMVGDDLFFERGPDPSQTYYARVSSVSVIGNTFTIGWDIGTNAFTTGESPSAIYYE